jgi:anti-sigma factor RsiW
MANALARIRFARDHRWSQRHMSEYIDDEMGADESERLERHTRACVECRSLLASLQGLVATLAGLASRRTESVADAVLEPVHARLAAEDDRLS